MGAGPAAGAALGPLLAQAGAGGRLGPSGAGGAGCGAEGFLRRARVAAARAGFAGAAPAGGAPAPRAVAVLGLGTPSWAQVVAGLALASGCFPALLPWRWGPAELRQALGVLRPAALLVDRACLNLLLEAFSGAEGEAAWGGELAGLGGLGERVAAAVPSLSAGRVMLLEDLASAASPGVRPVEPTLGPSEPAPADTCCVCFTSGSGGVPRAVPLSHAAFAAQARAKAEVMGFTASDVHLHLAPPFHVGGLCGLFTALHSGGRHVLLPKYCPRAAVEAARRHRVTALAVVPAVLDDIHMQVFEAGAAAAGSVTLDSVSTVLVGGAGPTPAQLRRAREVFPRASIYTAYGMTEACSSITFSALYLAPGAPATARDFAVDARDTWGTPGGVCVGRPLPHCEVTVITLVEATGGKSTFPRGANSTDEPFVQACVGQVGEVAVRGPAVAGGYIGKRGRFWQEWFLTGDAGFLDSRGRLFLSGRLKDVIRSGGETVHPAEVELVLAGMPGLRAVGVAAVPHPRLGETVGALLVLSEGWVWRGPGNVAGAGAAAASAPKFVTAALVKEYCRASGLAPYKAPRVMAVVAPGEGLPQTPLGKVDRKGVAAALLRLQEADAKSRARL